MARTLVSVQRDSGEPLYRQVRRALEHGIAMGRLDPAEPLPSSRELARELGLSRNTINTAYQELVAEGFIISRPRSGLFVNLQMRDRFTPVPDGAVEEERFDWESRLDSDLPSMKLPHVEKVAHWSRFPYPFICGQVDAESFPRLGWLRALRTALEPEHIHASLQDSLSADDPLLLQMLCRRILPSRGIEADPDQVLITMGSQQGLHLLAQTLMRKGTTVGIEEPGYLDARHIFVRAGATLRPFAVDQSGLVPPDPNIGLNGVDALYLTPSHHHPTNVTLSAARRQELLRQAKASGTILIEDDYDSEFRYRGSPTPALKALDNTGQVVYLGTFSKFLAPGLRMGYIVADPVLIKELREHRRYVLRHPPGHLARAMALFVESGEYHRTVRRQRRELQRRWEAINEAVETHLGWATDPPPGGVSLWLTGPPDLDCRALRISAAERGLIIERGDIFFLGDTPPRNHLRLGFSAIALEKIEPGVRLLAEIAEGKTS
jgi:GntR family transcriptional regulator / MocR family aminotransferase